MIALGTSVLLMSTLAPVTWTLPPRSAHHIGARPLTAQRRAILTQGHRLTHRSLRAPQMTPPPSGALAARIETIGDCHGGIFGAS